MASETEVKEGETIAVWVSCGAASAAAAILTCRQYGEIANIHLLNNPIAEEHKDNQRFVDDLSKFLGRNIERIINPAWPNHSIFEVFNKKRYMSGVAGAPCTGELKKKARQHWENNNNVDWHVMGFTSDEKNRHDRFVMTERDNVIPILIDRGMTKDDCGKMILSLGLRMPEVYSLGMPNANCVGCVKSSSPTYWNLIRKIDKNRFDKLCEVSREIGAKLVVVNIDYVDHIINKLVKFDGEIYRVKWNEIENKMHGIFINNEDGSVSYSFDSSIRIFLDELSEGAIGGDLKKMDLDCGFFCEEKWK